MKLNGQGQITLPNQRTGGFVALNSAGRERHLQKGSERIILS